MDFEVRNRALFLTLSLSLLCILVVIVGLRIMLQRIVKDLVGRAAHKQLLLDHEAMRKGLPLRALNTSPASSKKKLITAMAV